MTATVICVGHAVLDQVFLVDALPGVAGKFFAHERREIGGGPAANAAVTVARLGGRARLWTRLGDDGVGRQIRAGLEVEGVATGDSPAFDGHRSSCSAVLVDRHGERLIVNHTDAGMPADAGWLPLETVGEGDALLADRRWPEGALAALRAARAAGLPAILDADKGPEPVPQALIRAAGHVVFSADGLAQLTGGGDAPLQALESLREGHHDVMAVTMGGDGVHWIDGDGHHHHQPAFAVRAVDTLGAGDVFHGAYAFALASGRPVAAAMRLAAATAALKCTRPGGRDGIPRADEVETFIEDQAA
ncbi:MAG: PfkB family carbohydrate kinase [Azospirillaceae bacterium]